MNHYELLYIVGSQYTDEEVTEVMKNVNDLIDKVFNKQGDEQKGKVVGEKVLGKIRMAYPIKKIRHGTYVLSYIDASPASVADLDRELRLHDEVLRHTILTRPDGALDRTFELSSYVAPLSEEGRAQRRERKTPRPSETIASRTVEQPTKIPVQELPPALVSTTSTEEKTMSMEELDKKLDKILEGDVADNI
jgi:small subunit ribosomal protein S6